MKKRTLFQYHQELIEMQHSVVYFLNKGCIADFYKNYEVYINIITADIAKIQQAYFQYEEDGKVAFEGEGKDRKPKFQEGKTHEGYNKQWDALMSQSVLDKFTLLELDETPVTAEVTKE